MIASIFLVGLPLVVLNVQDGVPKEGIQVNDVLERIAKLDLIRKKVLDPSPFHIDDGGETNLLLSWDEPMAWTKEHDRRLLVGIVKYGCTLRYSDA